MREGGSTLAITIVRSTSTKSERNVYLAYLEPEAYRHIESNHELIHDSSVR